MKTLRTASIATCRAALLLAACPSKTETPKAAPLASSAPLGAPTLEGDGAFADPSVDEIRDLVDVHVRPSSRQAWLRRGRETRRPR